MHGMNYKTPTKQVGYSGGAEFLYTLKVNNEQHIFCLVPSHHNHAVGQALGIRLDVSDIVVFKTGKGIK